MPKKKSNIGATTRQARAMRARKARDRSARILNELHAHLTSLPNCSYLRHAAFSNDTHIVHSEPEFISTGMMSKDQSEPTTSEVKVKEENDEEIQRPLTMFLLPEEIKKEEVEKECEDPLATCHESAVMSEEGLSTSGVAAAPRFVAASGLSTATAEEQQPPAQPTGGQSHRSRHHKQCNIGHPNVCKECGKTFLYASLLRKHALRHIGEHLHKCNECGKKCFSASSLQAHTRIHTGERPHVCKVCGRSFMMAGHLQSHARLHTQYRTSVKTVRGPHCTYYMVYRYRHESTRPESIRRIIESG